MTAPPAQKSPGATGTETSDPAPPFPAPPSGAAGDHLDHAEVASATANPSTGHGHPVDPEEPICLTHEALKSLFGYLDEAVICLDEAGSIRFASSGTRALVGYDPDSLTGRNVLDFVHPGDVQRVVEAMAQWKGRAGTPMGRHLRVLTSDGSWRILSFDAVTGIDLGVLGDMVVTVHDPRGYDKEGRRFRRTLLSDDRMVRFATSFLEMPYERFDDGLDLAVQELAGLDRVSRASVWTVDDDHPDRLVRRAQWTAPTDPPRSPLCHSALFSRSSFLQLLGAGEEVHLDQSWQVDLDLADERALFDAAGLTSLLAVPMTDAGEFVGMVMLESTVGDVAFEALATSTLRSAAAILAGAFRRHRAELLLAVHARTDRVTGLGNRWAFDDSLAHALDDLGHGRTSGFGLALLDLDRFKVVNDALGHGAGDVLLARVAARLGQAADDRTVLGRLGGDELLVLVDDSPSVVESYARIHRLVDALEAPFQVAGAGLQVTASVGLVHVNQAGDDPGELLRRADVAMYRAKAMGGHTIEVDDPLEETHGWAELRRETELRLALREDGLEVHYQGEWDLSEGRLIGAEALVRWPHPADGLLLADDFVPLAEERGLVSQLGWAVLREACSTAAPWVSALGPERFTLRVNLAADQLHDQALPDEVMAVVADAGLPPEALCLELTESTLLADPHGSAALLCRLRESGIGLAIDDFGTGYSSMLQLKRLPLTAIKIDRTFVTGLPESDIDRAIVRSTLQLADALGVTVTAEGVETEAQRDALLALGCTRAQGYLLAKPESGEEFGGRVADIGPKAEVGRLSL